MIDRIRALERASRALEPDAARRGEITGEVFAYAERFLETLHTRKTFERGDQGAGLYDAPIGEEGAEMSSLLTLLERHVDNNGINPASGGHLGYIPGGGLYPSALGDFLADVSNRYAGVFFANPGAVRMEHLLTRWMASVVGFPATAAGTLTSGGSIATLTGIVTAREAHDVRAADIPRRVIYVTDHAHHSVDKAIRIAGLGECVLRRVPMDARYRMRTDALDAALGQDRADGLVPFLVVASAGTTDVGAVDPLDDIATIADDRPY